MLCSMLFLITFEQKASIFLVQFIAKMDVYYRRVLKCNLQLRECRLWFKIPMPVKTHTVVLCAYTVVMCVV